MYHTSPKDLSSDVESACRRLGLAARLLQTLTAEAIFAETEHHCTFYFAGDSTCPSNIPPRLPASFSTAAVWCIKSKLTFTDAQNLPALQLWEHLARELDGFFPEDRQRAKWLVVISCTEYRPLVDLESVPSSHEEAISRTKGYCALGTGGLALFGSGTLYTWPERIEDLESCLTNTKEVDRRRFLDDSAYRFTYWANYSTALGTMLHELGHCFDLDHAPSGIMRRGGDDLNLILAFPPPGGQSNSPNNDICSYHFLSIFQFHQVTFYENVLTDCQNASSVQWSDSDPTDDIGQAFWGQENSQFLSFHRWFLTGSEANKCTCKTRLNNGVLISPCGIRLVQMRICDDTCSPNSARIWNINASIKLPLDAALMHGCVIHHDLFQEPRRRIAIFKTVKRIFSKLKSLKLKIVALNIHGDVFQEIVNKDSF
ncbi:hypothetical protein Aperf_G00000101934 [Anoplocephala perfoliata]